MLHGNHDSLATDLSVTQLARQRRALERFTLMSYNEWHIQKFSQLPEDDGSLADILAKGVYHMYVQRKGIERARLNSILINQL